ncbi:helix-turn-helix domain-containing protein [Roseobacter litoralis]|uniref:helix-turn-helix domain-containing protein n=1 Tax=Roseobacter litoralis TaxID=42443 RepID=UPI00249235C1|nr:AraC family transcriptional regulator [Roseobacter litoralis]
MSKSLPLVQLQLLHPLIAGLRSYGVDPDPVLESVGLTQTAVDQEGASVHVMVMHHLLENCAVAANDQTFCAKIGSQLDPTGWPMVRDAFQRATTLGDFLNIYVAQAHKYASSATSYVEVRGDMATFGETRKFKPLVEPAQNDGFMIALKMAMLGRVLGEIKEPERVLLVLSDPAVLPNALKRFQALRGNNMGCRVQFPSEWLLRPNSESGLETGFAEQGTAKQQDAFLISMRQLLGQQIGNGGLSANEAAELMHMSSRKLARMLSKLGTSVSKELSKAKIEHAKEVLLTTDRSVEDIAASLGYSDPSNFARAFSKVVRSTPSAFRDQFK